MDWVSRHGSKTPRVTSGYCMKGIHIALTRFELELTRPRWKTDVQVFGKIAG